MKRLARYNSPKMMVFADQAVVSGSSFITNIMVARSLIQMVMESMMNWTNARRLQVLRDTMDARSPTQMAMASMMRKTNARQFPESKKIRDARW